MNTVFISEQGFIGKVPKDFNNMRTEFGWMIAFDAFHMPYTEAANPDSLYKSVIDTADLIILIPSKKHPEYLNIAFYLKDKVIGIMQEGDNALWQDWPVANQMIYLAILKEKASIVFCHNQRDQNYFTGLTHKPVCLLPTMNKVSEYASVNPSEDETVFVGGNMCRWYGGMNSYSVARHANMKKIIIPSMGRKREDEENLMTQLDGRVEYLPYLEWDKFMTELSRAKYAIHLMPEAAAGSFSLNCAMLGIPCIGNQHDDTQKVCFPDLSIDVTDLPRAITLFNRLMNDKPFYDAVSKLAKKRAQLFDLEYQGKLVKAYIEDMMKITENIDLDHSIRTLDGRPAGTPMFNALEQQYSINRYSFPLKHDKDFFTNKRVLDVGCGWGAGTKELVRQGASKVVAVDLHPQAIEIAKQNFDDPKIEWSVQNLVDCPMMEPFDVINCVETIEHMDGGEVSTQLDWWKTVLKPNGLVYVTTPELRGDKSEFPKGSHWTEYEFQELVDIFVAKGYELVWHMRKTETNDTGMALVFRVRGKE